jgi:hypothetical protein
MLSLLLVCAVLGDPPAASPVPVRTIQSAASAQTAARERVAPGAPVVAADVAVVVPREYRKALEPWVAYRQEQGHVIALLEPASPEKLREKIREVAAGGKLTHIVLVGDADVPRNQGVHPAVVPTFKVKAEVNVKFGSEPEIAADNPYADLNDDGLPDVAIGRISVDRPDQLTSIVRKIIDYESNENHGHWRSRVNLVAGVGGFGSLIDSTIEMTAKKFLCDGVPASYNTTMTYGSWRSPYCPDPRRFQDEVVNRFNEGALFWVYIGHGHPERLDRIHVPGAAYPILDQRDLARLDYTDGAPIAVLLACYTGAFDFPRECLAEEMLRLPGGPVAVLAGSRVTMPYAMAVLSSAMIEECFQNRPKTLGEIVLQAKRRSVVDAEPLSLGEGDEPAKIDNRQILDALGKLLSPRPDLLADERREHLALFNLLGDPLLRIAYPETVDLETPEEATAGGTLALKLSSPIAGKCTVQLVCRRDHLTFDPPSRSEFSQEPAALAALHAVYEKANDHRFDEHVIDILPGSFEADLPIPASARGPRHVRVFLEGEGRHAVGASSVFVRRPLKK